MILLPFHVFRAYYACYKKNKTKMLKSRFPFANVRDAYFSSCNARFVFRCRLSLALSSVRTVRVVAIAAPFPRKLLRFVPSLYWPPHAKLSRESAFTRPVPRPRLPSANSIVTNDLRVKFHTNVTGRSLPLATFKPRTACV